MKKKQRNTMRLTALFTMMVMLLSGFAPLGMALAQSETTRQQTGCSHVHDETCGYSESEGCIHAHDAGCGGTDLGAPSATDDISGNVIVTSFAALAETVQTQTYEVGSVTLEDLILPESLAADSANGEALTITGVTWECTRCPKGHDDDAAFDPMAVGDYIFTPALPEGYASAAESAVPTITVTVRPAAVRSTSPRMPRAAAGDFVITKTGGGDPINNTDYSYEGGLLTIKSSTAMTVSMRAGVTTTTNTIQIAPNVAAVMTLNGVIIDVSGISGSCALDAGTAAETTIILAEGSTNTLKSGFYKAGLHVPEGKSTAIQGPGKLTAQGGTSGAGIGGGYQGSGGTINISGGTVNAIGDAGGAGIGGGNQGSGGTINISGGTVNAIGDAGGAGIGGGNQGNGGSITISGGTVTAQGGDSGAGIGGGSEGNGGSITISGGTVTAQGGTSGAGIGGGSQGNGGNIAISGGTVTALGKLYGAGIGGYQGSGGNITISGGIVTAKGGSQGTGIGDGINGGDGTITISGGTVTAHGGMHRAGIGGGSNGIGSSITISGGTVSATGGANGAGIGGGLEGSVGSITISGGTVNATGGIDASDIGTGHYGTGGSVTITGGSIKTAEKKISPAPKIGSEQVYLVTLTLVNSANMAVPNGAVSNSTFGNYGLHDVKTDGEGKLYFWLPAKAYGTSKVWADASRYSGNVTVATGNQNAYTLKVSQELKITQESGEPNGCSRDPNTNGIKINKPGDYTISMMDNVAVANTETITVTTGGTTGITLNGVHIDVSGTQKACALDTGLTGETTIIPAEGSTNTLKSGKDQAGLHAPTGKSLIIQGSGQLTAQGGSDGAGIGGGYNGGGGTITISGGIVTAKGGSRGAGIGGGFNGGGTINISGGTVDAIGGQYGAGIGGGDRGGGTINISGGRVTAQGGQYGAGIGGGRMSSGGSITISGGTVSATGSGASDIGSGSGTVSGPVSITGGSIKTAQKKISPAPQKGSEQVYLVTLTLVNSANTAVPDGAVSNSTFGNYGLHDVKTDGEGKLYFWLPAKNYGESKVWADATGYSGNVTVVTGNQSAYTLKASHSQELRITQESGEPNGFSRDPITNGIKINKSGDYTISMMDNVAVANTETITVTTGGTTGITLNGVNIDVSGTSGSCALDTGSTGETTIIPAEGSTNTLKSGRDKAGVQAPTGKSLIIQGPGQLTAQGGYYGAGIGGGYNGDSGTITISGGRVTAQGGGDGAGIGGGYQGGGGTITISGGRVDAIGGYCGAGIGGGLNGIGGRITISGGTVSATGIFASDIGPGANGADDIVTIDGGSVKASQNKVTPQPQNSVGNRVYLNTLTLENQPADTPVIGGSIGGVSCSTHPDAAKGVYGIKDVKTDGDGRVYFYLPPGTEPQKVSAQISENAVLHTYTNTYTVKANNTNGETLYKNARPPAISTQPVGANYNLNEKARPISVSATSPDGGNLSYRWYKTETDTNTGGTPVGENNNAYTPPTNNAGTAWYYCVVTNTNNNMTGEKTLSTASNTAKITVNKEDLELTLTCGNIVYGQKPAPQLEGNLGGGAVTFKYKLQGADDDSYTETPPTDVGDYTLQASVAATANYNAGSTVKNFTIGKATPGITFTVTKVNAITADLTVTLKGAAGGNLPTGKVGFYNGGGLLEEVELKDGTATYCWTNIEEGDHSLRAEYAGDKNYENASAAKSYNRAKQDQESLAITGIPDDITVETPSFTLKTEGGSGEGAITYAVTSGNDIVEVDTNTGEVSVKKVGEAQITVTKAGDNDYNEASATAQINVERVDLRLGLTCPNITYGEKPQPVLTGNTENGAVTWEYKEKGADDNTYSPVVPTEAGAYTLRATVAETANYNSGSTTTDFSIKKANLELGLTCDDITYSSAPFPRLTGNVVGGDVTYHYKVKDADDSTYSPVVPTEVGTYTVRATVAETANYNGGSGVADFKIEQASPYISLSATPADSGVATEDLTLRAVLSPFGSGDTPTGEVKFKNGETELGTVEITKGIAEYTWQNVPAGIYDLTAEYQGNLNYTNKSDRISGYKVNKLEQGTLTIIDVPREIAYGDTFTIGIEGGSDTIAPLYEVTKGNDIITIDKTTGEVRVIGVGDAEIKAVKPEDEKYKEAETTLAITARKKEQSALKIIGVPESVTFGDPAFTIGVEGGSDTIAPLYEVTKGDNIITIDKTTGEVRVIGVGDAEIKAVKPENDQYLEITVTVSISVNQATPIISGDLKAGEANVGKPLGDVSLPDISATDLNGKPLAGKLEWQEPTALVQGAGEYIAVFTPEDPNYAPRELKILVSLSTTPPTINAVRATPYGSAGAKLEVDATAQSALSFKWQVKNAEQWEDIPGGTTADFDYTGLTPETQYTVRVMVTDANGNTATSDEVSFTTGAKYTERTLTDEATGIIVTGWFTDDATLTIKANELHEAGTCAACDAIRAKQGAEDLLLLYDISATGHRGDEVTISIPVGSQYNGQILTVLHCNRGMLEEKKLVVTDGMLTGTFSGLSPYAVLKPTAMPKPTHKDKIQSGTGKTGDESNLALWLTLMMMAGAGMTGTMIYKRRKIK